VSSVSAEYRQQIMKRWGHLFQKSS